MSEIWKASPYYPRYEVSTLGRVRNIKTGRLLRVSADARNYLHVAVTDCFKETRRTVSWLVFTTHRPMEYSRFIDNNGTNVLIRFKNLNSLDCSLDNLYLQNMSDSIKAAWRTGQYKNRVMVNGFKEGPANINWVDGRRARNGSRGQVLERQVA